MSIAFLKEMNQRLVSQNWIEGGGMRRYVASSVLSLSESIHPAGGVLC